MKKTILLALMVVVATTAVTAQEFEKQDKRRGAGPEKRVEKQMKRLDKKLNLTDEQKQILTHYYGEFYKAQHERMEQMRKQEKEEREALNGKINSILTDEQKAKFAQMKEKEKEAWKEGKGHQPGRGPGRGHGAHGGPDGMGGYDRDMNQ